MVNGEMNSDNARRVHLGHSELVLTMPISNTVKAFNTLNKMTTLCNTFTRIRCFFTCR